MAADLDRDDVIDAELVDRVVGQVGFLSVSQRPARSSGPAGPGFTKPADRITLRIPAPNPRSRNTIKPHGDVPNSRSIPHPIAAPTTTPATKSAPRRMAKA